MGTDKDLGKAFESRIRYGATGDLDKEFSRGHSAIEFPSDPGNPR